MQLFVRLLPGAHLRHELGNAVDQDTFVMDRRESTDTWSYLDSNTVVLVLQQAVVRLRGQGEDGMLHGRHVILGDGIEHVADEEILIRVPVRKERKPILPPRSSFVVSVTLSAIRGFVYTPPEVVVSVTRTLASWFQ